MDLGSQSLFTKNISPFLQKYAIKMAAANIWSELYVWLR